MGISELLSELRGDERFMANVVTWRTLPASAARSAPFPPSLHGRLQSALAARGIDSLYVHQVQAVELAAQGANLAIVTPTASGKTLCYNLPVFDTLLRDPGARALYLFPTKALAQDQLAELQLLSTSVAQTPPAQSFAPGIFTYDGDTPSARRGAVRRNARILLSNPDMLHAGMLPYHTNWSEFFGTLAYVIIDEMHVYRGVFGSHVANLLRRLKRVCAFYGAAPQFICTSATIANPGDLAQRLIEEPVTVIDRHGAPQGEKHIVLYNPPLIDEQQGLRRSSLLETQDLATRSILSGVQTLVFGRSRLTTEVLLSYIRERVRQAPKASGDAVEIAIRGYRGGYLPAERRAIEAGLRNGEVQGVIATNALELGIDIGELHCVLLCGYPGSIASTWQQIGRAGRQDLPALALMVATAGALDQYVARHPEFLFEQTPERALINPDNLMILTDQIRCAAFELPFGADEEFGACTFTQDVLALLIETGEVIGAAERRLWNGVGYPAHAVSLRSAGNDNLVIQTAGGRHPTILGIIDRASAPLLVYDGAIYLHEGQSYRVESLALDEGVASVSAVEVDYYSEVVAQTEIRILAEAEHHCTASARVGHGDLLVTSQVTGFRRIKRFTHETVGTFPLDYEPQQLETSGTWFGILPATQHTLALAGNWFDSQNDYGPNWQAQRRRVRVRDGYQCHRCGTPEETARQHDVHHRIPFRTFGYVPGVNDHYLEANRLDNLMLLCRPCHQRLESAVRTRSGLDGVAYAIGNVAPLHLMCDARDIGVSIERTRPLGGGVDEGTPQSAQLPTLYLFERHAAGLGFHTVLYELHATLLLGARKQIRQCPCERGCPACVGPIVDATEELMQTKRLALALLDELCA